MNTDGYLDWLIVHCDLLGDLHHVEGEVADGFGVVCAGLGQAAHCHVFITHCLHLVHIGVLPGVSQDVKACVNVIEQVDDLDGSFS